MSISIIDRMAAAAHDEHVLIVTAWRYNRADRRYRPRPATVSRWLAESHGDWREAVERAQQKLAEKITGRAHSRWLPDVQGTSILVTPAHESGWDVVSGAWQVTVETTLGEDDPR